jgi:hypothetical protein
MRAAVVELNYYHDETLPTVVYALNQLGFDADVYLPARAARKNAFGLTTGLRYERLLTDSRSRLGRAKRRIRGTPARTRRYDALVMNSIEPIDRLEFASRINLPTIAIVHNADLLRNDRYVDFFSTGSRLPLFLGRHVANAAGGDHGDAWLAPVYLGDVAAATPPREITVFCVQGNVEFGRRDYAGLVDAAITLATERSDFAIRMVGRSGTRDGEAFRATIRAAGVAELFQFGDGEISYSDYLTDVATSDWVLPLLDPSVPGLASYFSVKITSSMSMAIGLGVPAVAESLLADHYGVSHAAVTYPAGGLLGGMRAALAMPAQTRALLSRNLADVRAELLATSVRNVAQRLKHLGLAIA